MTAEAATTRNADRLRARFAQIVLEQQPASVLDVGCGAGAVMARLGDAGVPVAGFETDPACREALRAAGRDVLPVPAEGEPAETLTTGDDTFDWVVMRHVPHHLADPGRMVRECLRVARRGIVIAEPWFDLRIPSQRAAKDLDLWLKEGHRQLGRIHERNLDLEVLLDLVPEDVRARAELEWEQQLYLAPRRLEDVEAEMHALNDALPPEPRRVRSFAALRQRAATQGITCNGSLVLTVRLRGNPAAAAR